MTDRLDSLKALREKVREGDEYIYDLTAFDIDQWDTVSQAFHGSLDAARELHDAVLTGWGWSTGVYGARVWPGPDEMARRPSAIQVEDHEISPARAWLIAILSALITIEEGKA